MTPATAIVQHEEPNQTAYNHPRLAVFPPRTARATPRSAASAPESGKLACTRRRLCLFPVFAIQTSPGPSSFNSPASYLIFSYDRGRDHNTGIACSAERPDRPIGAPVLYQGSVFNDVFPTTCQRPVPSHFSLASSMEGTHLAQQ